MTPAMKIENVVRGKLLRERNSPQIIVCNDVPWCHFLLGKAIVMTLKTKTTRIEAENGESFSFAHPNELYYVLLKRLLCLGSIFIKESQS